MLAFEKKGYVKLKVGYEIVMTYEANGMESYTLQIFTKDIK